MNNGKDIPKIATLFDDPAFLSTLETEPARTVDLLKSHVGRKRALDPEIERVCWRVFVDHCAPGELARTVLQRLNLDSEEHLLDLGDEERVLLERYFKVDLPGDTDAGCAAVRSALAYDSLFLGEEPALRSDLAILRLELHRALAELRREPS
jgi:hypothetical protein